MTTRVLTPTVAVAVAAMLAGGEARALQFEDASVLVASFSHQSGANGGDGLAGVAWLDYDNDGFLDLFFSNGKFGANALFRNQDGAGNFVDNAVAAGVAGGGGSSGVVAADFDNDGFTDLFLTGDGGLMGTGESPVVLYRNNGDGTFTDVTAASSIDDTATHAAAAAGDINNDGLLDLYVTGVGSLATGTQDRSSLYLNKGAFEFKDISSRSGVDTARGACAAYFADLNDDNMQDLVVGNCNEVNFAPTPIELFRNNGDLTFTDIAAQPGLKSGGYWMGLCPSDFDNDGDTDMFVTNVGGALRPHALYDNNGDATFTNIGASAMVSEFEFGWGCASADVDNDGWDDIFFAGALPALLGMNAGSAGRMFINNHDGTFADDTASMPLDLTARFTSGVATGDYDGDGFEDIAVASDELSSDGGHPVLYHNLGNSNGRIQVELQGTISNRDGVGAVVEVTAGALTQRDQALAGASFASTSSPTLGFGLGSEASADMVTVRWPSGLVETVSSVAGGTLLSMVEGTCGGDPAGCVFCGNAAFPAGSCRAAGKASIRMVDASNDSKDQLRWSWKKGDATALADFKSPTSSRTVTSFCIFDASANSQPRMQAQVPVGGVCKKKPCWKAVGTTKLKYKSKTGAPQGIAVAKYKAGAAGDSVIQLKGKGEHIPMPTLGLTLPVTVQLLVDDGSGGFECWQSTYSVAKVNDASRFVAESP